MDRTRLLTSRELRGSKPTADEEGDAENDAELDETPDEWLESEDVITETPGERPNAERLFGAIDTLERAGDEVGEARSCLE
jgi:hypothetical protein